MLPFTVHPVGDCALLAGFTQRIAPEIGAAVAALNSRVLAAKLPGVTETALSGRICPAPRQGRRNFLSIKIPLYRVIQRLNNLNAALMCLGSGSCTEDEPTP